MPRIIVFIFILGLLATKAVAQEQSMAKIKSAYLFRFAENTTWPNEGELKTFNIGVYGTANDIYEELTEIKKGYRLKGLSIELRQIKNLDGLSQIQMLYMPNLKCLTINSVLTKALDQNILLVSDQCESNNAKMINFIYSSDHKIQFEVNTTNIKNAGLSINPKLLLLGGEESEALEVLIESEKSLLSEKQRANQLKKELSALRVDWEKAKVKYDKQVQLIAKQADKLKAQKDEMNTLSDSIAHQQSRYSDLQSGIADQAMTIDKQQAILDEKLIEIESQSEAFIKNKQLLADQTSKLENQVKLIGEHEKMLDKQVSIIQWQKYGLILAIVLIVLTLSFVASIIRNSRIKKRAFALLEKQNHELVDSQNEISRQNVELKNQRQELMEMTEALRTKSEQLQKSVAEVEKANKEISEINENLEETVKIRTEELREQHEKILNYLSHNSHIVRGPLSRILGLTNVFNATKPEEAGQILEDVTLAAQEVDKVVNEINEVLESEREKFEQE